MKRVILAVLVSLSPLAALAQLPQNPSPSLAIGLSSNKERILAGTLRRASGVTPGGDRIADFTLEIRGKLINVVFDRSQLEAANELIGERVLLQGLDAFRVVETGAPVPYPVFYAYFIELDRPLSR